LAGGEVSGEDGVEFDAWLEARAGNRAAFAQAAAFMAEFDAPAGDVLGELGRSARPRGGPHRRPSPLRWMGPAGGFALAAGPPQIVVETQTTTFATAKGQHQHVVLADGSSVDLDAETRLTVAMSRGERRVTLADGQAIFDVRHDANRPFVVAAGDRLIRDLG